MTTIQWKWPFLVCLCLTLLWGCAAAQSAEDEARTVKPPRTTPAPISYGEWLKRNYPAPQLKKKNEENGKNGDIAWSSLRKN